MYGAPLLHGYPLKYESFKIRVFVTLCFQRGSNLKFFW